MLLIYLACRFIHALRQIKDSEIVVLAPDKGGGVALLSQADYKKKMEDLLSDQESYRSIPDGECQLAAEKYTKDMRALLRRSKEGRCLEYLLQQRPRNARMRSLPKIHKPGIPMVPITSGIGSEPHKLAKHLAKFLSAKLGSINEAHLWNSTDLIGRLKKISLRNKKLVSFDVKSLFTNVPVDGALKSVERAIKNDTNLPLPKRTF